MNATNIALVLGAVGIGAIVSAIIAGLFSKKKLGAEATEIITKAAAGVVTNLQTEIDRQVKMREALQADIDRQRTEHLQAIANLMASHADEVEEMRRVLQLHVAWDAIAIAKMAEVGVNLPPAPPLLPARRFDHPTGDVH